MNLLQKNKINLRPFTKWTGGKKATTATHSIPNARKIQSFFRTFYWWWRFVF